MQETDFSIPIQLLTTEQLKIYQERHCILGREYFDLELAIAIRKELDEREVKEQLTNKTTQKSFRWDIATYTLMTVIAILCGLQLRTIFYSIKCPIAPIAEELINE